MSPCFNSQVLTQVISGHSSYSAGLDHPLYNINDVHQDVQHPARLLHRDTELTPSERSPGGGQTQRCFRLSGRVTQTTRREDGPDWTLNRGELLPLFHLLLLLFTPEGFFFFWRNVQSATRQMTLSEETSRSAAVSKSGLAVFRWNRKLVSYKMNTDLESWILWILMQEWPWKP